MQIRRVNEKHFKVRPGGIDTAFGNYTDTVFVYYELPHVHKLFILRDDPLATSEFPEIESPVKIIATVEGKKAVLRIKKFMLIWMQEGEGIFKKKDSFYIEMSLMANHKTNHDKSIMRLKKYYDQEEPS